VTYTPSNISISNITKANPAVVTTSTDHNLTTGQTVRLLVPVVHGMVELNNTLNQITNLSTTTFSINSPIPPFTNIDSTSFTTFVNTTSGTPAQVIPVGSSPTPLTAPSSSVLQGTYITTLDDATSNIATTNQPF